MIYIIPVPGIDNYIIVTTVIMTTIISTMVAPMVTAIYTNCHNSCKSKPGGIISIIIRRDVGNIGRRIHVLYDGSRLNNLYRSCWCRYCHYHRIFTFIAGIRRNRGISFWFNNIILSVQFFISNNLQAYLFILVFIKQDDGNILRFSFGNIHTEYELVRVAIFIGHYLNEINFFVQVQIQVI